MSGRSTVVVAAVVLAGALGGDDLSAQTVRGRVTTAQSGNPVVGTLVVLLDPQGTETARTQSGADGDYVVAAPAPGVYRLRFSVPGYRPLVSRSIQLVAGQILNYPLQMTAVPPELLDTVIVEGRPIPAYMAPFYRRRDFGLGRFLVREDIERMRTANISGVVRRLNVFDILGDLGDGTGIRIGQRARTGRGFCPAALFVNGTFAGMSGDMDVDMMLHIDATEAIEVYRANETVPPELRVPVASIRGGRSGGCGVLSLWSRVSAPDTTGLMRHLALGVHGGARLGSSGVQHGRLGLALSYTVKGAVEFYPAVNVYAPVPNTTGSPALSGWQLVLTLRAHPLGPESPWYIGTGVTHVQFTQQQVFDPRRRDVVEGQQHLLLSGLVLSGGAWRPYVELHLLSPLRFSAAQTSLFLGVARRFF